VYGLTCKVYGEICKVDGLTCKVYGEICKVYGLTCKVYGEICKVYGLTCKVYGLTQLDLIISFIATYCFLKQRISINNTN
jgi:hypothetical protein